MEAGGDLQGHGFLPLAGILGQSCWIQVGEQGDVVVHHGIRHLLQLGIGGEGILLKTDGVAQTLAHLLASVNAREDGHQQPELWRLAKMTL